MSFTAAIRSVLTQYVGFRGRARRSEYWWFLLFTFLVVFVAGILDAVLQTNIGSDGYGLISTIAVLALLLPALAVSVRRLHDTNRSGWWVLIGAVPIVGPAVQLAFSLLDGTPGMNRYGADPKESQVAAPGPA